MSEKKNLSRRQKTELIRALVEWGGEANAIDASVAEIEARLSERLARSISGETTRTYLKDTGIAWKKTSPRAPHRGKDDRIARLAGIVERLMRNLDGLGSDDGMLDEVHRIASKQPPQNGHADTE